MSRLLVVGAGGCGREVLHWARDICKVNPRWDEFAFLDVDESVLKGKKEDTPIIGDETNYIPKDGDEFVCAFGNSALRRKTAQIMKNKGARYVSLVHPTAIVADSVEISDGVIIYPQSLVSSDSYIGEGSIVNTHCSIGHDVTIGKYTTVCPQCGVSGMCEIGENVFIGTGVKVVPSVKIGDDAFICAGSTVMTKIKKGTKKRE